MKQVLVESATRLPHANIFEQVRCVCVRVCGIPSWRPEVVLTPYDLAAAVGLCQL